MFNHRWFTLFTLLVVFSLSACQSAPKEPLPEKPKEAAPTQVQPPTQAPQPKPTRGETSPMIISEQDNGKTIELNTGAKLAVSLQSNPTTGYLWEVDKVDAAILKSIGEDEFKIDSPELVGSGGTQTLGFSALKSGETKLVLVYHRPWEKDVPAEKTFEVTIKIK